MRKDDVFAIPHVAQFSAYHQPLQQHNHLHPSLELWKGLKKSRSWREAGTTCPENTVQLDKTVCGCSPLRRAPQETRFRSSTRLCLSLQRVKLIPRVFIPTAELLQTWLTQQSRFKINDERVSKYSFYTDDLLFLSTTGKTHTVDDYLNLLSLFPLLSQMEFLLE